MPELLARLTVIEHNLSERINRVMSAISDFSAKVTAFFDRQDTAITDLQGDVDNLQKQIAALQNSAGQITPEDQALLDAITTRAQTVSDKLDALDQLTPPAPPA
jgi:peptidoglycan hydrolase CwlO-like protein